MSRTQHSHMIASEAPKQFKTWDSRTGHESAEFEDDIELTAMCGETTRGSWNLKQSWSKFTYDGAHISCPKCNKKIAQAQIKARSADRPALTAEADPEAKGGFRHKQGWKVLLGSELIGYVGFEEHAWRIYPLQIESYDEKAKESGPYIRNARGVLDRDGDTGSKAFGSWSLPAKSLHYKSKEAAMLGCEAMYASGILKSGPQLFAEREEANARAQVAMAERRQKESDKTERRNDTLAALQEILDKETLSNFQRMGLMNAIADLTPKQTPSVDD